ncbi:hypothetical protein IW261DRAFT_1458387 [Armillaria novae-zelandiae]|uniref:RING-type domain-containing protein n=1 Tax=Armillaria novae-zelandiae TaxID=153914 RepID=A0AA39PI58_9AGAR|nr:hypothetical protein IW261DRAFT_1458387 [Armillaria novae-zelandiae]
MTGSCSICISEPDTPVCPPCGHVYCSGCLANHIASYTTIEQGLPTSWCPNCRVHFPLGEPDSNGLQYIAPIFRPFVASAIRRLFPGDGSAELDLDKVPGVRKLKRRLRAESKANFRRRKEIEQLNERLRVMEDEDRTAKDDRAASLREIGRLRNQLRDEQQRCQWKEQRHQNAKDDLAACRHENNRLRIQLRDEQQRDRWEELEPELKSIFVIGWLTVAVITICVVVIAYKAIPFRMLFDWYMIFLRTMYRLWVEVGYPSIVRRSLKLSRG